MNVVNKLCYELSDRCLYSVNLIFITDEFDIVTYIMQNDDNCYILSDSNCCLDDIKEIISTEGIFSWPNIEERPFHGFCECYDYNMLQGI